MSRLKYDPKKYVEIAKITSWLKNGENVQWRRTGAKAKAFGGRWAQWAGACSVEPLLKDECEFRIKPAKKENDK